MVYIWAGNGKRSYKPLCAECRAAKTQANAERRRIEREEARRDREASPCDRCGVRPRHRFPSGKASRYCRECVTLEQRDRRHGVIRDDLWRVGTVVYDWSGFTSVARCEACVWTRLAFDMVENRSAARAHSAAHGQILAA